MSEKEFKQIFSKKLRHYLKINGMTQAELAQKLGVGTTSVYNWCNEVKMPRMNKLRALCDLFECSALDLLTEDSQEYYYLNDDVRKIEPHTSERLLLDTFGKLNDLGQDEAIKRIEELTQIKKYTQTDAEQTKENKDD